MAIARASPRAGARALHAILLGFPIALFSGAFVSDIAYLRTAEAQWTNFATNGGFGGGFSQGAPTI